MTDGRGKKNYNGMKEVFQKKGKPLRLGGSGPTGEKGTRREKPGGRSREDFT